MIIAHKAYGIGSLVMNTPDGMTRALFQGILFAFPSKEMIPAPDWRALALAGHHYYAILSRIDELSPASTADIVTRAIIDVDNVINTKESTLAILGGVK